MGFMDISNPERHSRWTGQDNISPLKGGEIVVCLSVLDGKTDCPRHQDKLSVAIPTCQYPCSFHCGKIEFHHPISTAPSVGVELCEAHHSLLAGRKRRYPGECIINKSIKEMREEVWALVLATVRVAGYHKGDIDKR